MKLAGLVLCATAALAPVQAAADPLSGFVESFFNYREPPPPVGEDCGAVAAAIGAGETWYGEFSGKRLDFNENYQPFAARGCFESKSACRYWQQQAINYAFGTITYTSCRRGAASAF